MSISEFLKDLPSHNKQNFQLFNPSSDTRTGSRRQVPIYLPTSEIPSEQVIITEKKHILLRYLHQQWDKKNNSKKRENSENVLTIPVKRVRLEEAN